MRRKPLETKQHERGGMKFTFVCVMLRATLWKKIPGASSFFQVWTTAHCQKLLRVFFADPVFWVLTKPVERCFAAKNNPFGELELQFETVFVFERVCFGFNCLHSSPTRLILPHNVDLAYLFKFKYYTMTDIFLFGQQLIVKTSEQLRKHFWRRKSFFLVAQSAKKKTSDDLSKHIQDRAKRFFLQTHLIVLFFAEFRPSSMNCLSAWRRRHWQRRQRRRRQRRRRKGRWRRAKSFGRSFLHLPIILLKLFLWKKNAKTVRNKFVRKRKKSSNLLR